MFSYGYNSQYNDGPEGKIRSLTTVVFDPKIIHAK